MNKIKSFFLIICVAAFLVKPAQSADLTEDIGAWVEPYEQLMREGKCEEAVSMLITQGVKRKPLAYGLLGELYEDGKCVKRDIAAAYYFYEQEVGNDTHEFQFRLGMMDLHGRGVFQNFKRAQKRFRAGALKIAEGKFKYRKLMTTASLRTRHIPEPIQKALDWIRGIELGDVEGRLSLARKLLNGDGVPRNPVMALYLIGEDVKHKNLEALLFWGEVESTQIYSKDDPDLDSARWYFLVPAEKGVKKAQYRLSHLYADRQPTKENLKEALIWATLADWPGDEAFREELTFLLDPDDLDVVKIKVSERQSAYTK